MTWLDCLFLIKAFLGLRRNWFSNWCQLILTNCEMSSWILVVLNNAFIILWINDQIYIWCFKKRCASFAFVQTTRVLLLNWIFLCFNQLILLMILHYSFNYFYTLILLTATRNVDLKRIILIITLNTTVIRHRGKLDR